MDRDKIRTEQVYLINDSFQNRKQYNISKAQLVLTDIQQKQESKIRAWNSPYFVI